MGPPRVQRRKFAEKNKNLKNKRKVGRFSSTSS